MTISSTKTPRIAAFFLAALVVACSPDKTSDPADSVACNALSTPIANVQGSRPQSSMVGQAVDIQGIVTLIRAGEGIFIEEPDSDDDDRTSNAIFVELSAISKDIRMGTRVRVRGTVAELRKGRNSLTALVNTEELQVCGHEQTLPLTSISLPLKGLEREAVEAMRVSLPDTLTVIDNYRLNKGQISVSGNGFQYTATELMQPGAKASEYAYKKQTFTLTLQLQEPVNDARSFTAGANISNIIGVLTHDDRELRLSVASLEVSSQTDGPSAITPPPAPALSASRVVGMNLYNYFNGDGRGGGFPAPRGAKTRAEFEQQRARIGAALQALKPQLIAVMELENDGFGADSATADFIRLLDQEAGGSWAAARPENDNTGSDAIRVGLFYRSDLWQAEGSAHTLSGPEFKRSRQPLAQVFTPIGGGESLLLAVNHLKSKGSCPASGENADQKDGQACWSALRTVSAQKMSAWVKALAATSQSGNIMIMGDMNSYRRETPVDAIRAAGFVELLDTTDGRPFSYVYFGQAGTLDYAFVNPELEQRVQNAFIWHVNSIMPADTKLPQPWLRFSDHDPVVVDLSLRH